MRWVGNVALRGKEGCIQSFGGEPEGIPFVSPIRRWKDTIKMDYQEVGRGGRACTGLLWLGIGTGSGLL